MHLDYFNYMSVPSGKKFKLNEISNKDYIVLLKFLNAENYKDFYKCLDLLIRETIPEFDSLGLIDKAYTYIAFFYYNMKPVLTIKSPNGLEEGLELAPFLEQLEAVYKPVNIKAQISRYPDCDISWPSDFDFQEEQYIVIDKTSILKSIAGVPLDKEKRHELNTYLQAADFNTLDDIYKKNFEVYLALFQNTSVQGQFKKCRLSDIFYIIINIYKEGLESYYKLLYVLIHYGRLSYSDILLMSPVELSIYYNNFTEDKEKQREENKFSVSDPNVNDSLMGL